MVETGFNMYTLDSTINLFTMLKGSSHYCVGIHTINVDVVTFGVKIRNLILSYFNCLVLPIIHSNYGFFGEILYQFQFLNRGVLRAGATGLTQKQQKLTIDTHTTQSIATFMCKVIPS